jgi:hypothetical protein
MTEGSSVPLRDRGRDGFCRLPHVPPACGLLTVVCLAGVMLGCGGQRVPAPRADAEAAVRLRDNILAATAAGESTQNESPVGTGWASLSGRFVYAGGPTAPKALVVDKDTEVCSKDGMKLFDRSLLIDPATKGLANVVVFVRKSSRVKDPTPTTPLVFDQKNCEFISPVFAARVGQPIDVRNSDPVGHNTNLAGTSFNQLIPAGQGTLFTPAAETGMPVTVTCNIHPWMKAYAIFRKDGYVAVSGQDGRFVLADLPAGEPLEFQVWHERSTGPNGALGLAVPELKWTNKGRFQVTLQPDETKDIGTLEVPAGVLGS